MNPACITPLSQPHEQRRFRHSPFPDQSDIIIGAVHIEASAPTRIDLAGGTIDIWPLYLFHDRAQTLNAAISLRAHVDIRSRDDGRLAVESVDTGRKREVARWSDLKGDHEIGLLGRLLEFFRVGGASIVTRAEAPAGAGIAGSSALNIAVCGAIRAWTGAGFDDQTLLQIAMNVEAQAIGVPTGVQDYRPALYGGVAAIELEPGGVGRVELPIEVTELERRIVLAYTGAPRESGINNWEITKRHIDGDRQVFDCFERIRDTAVAMREALAAGDWQEVGRQIGEEWETRKRLAPGVTTPAIDALIARARAAGAISGKICGAGGGGCLICYGDPQTLPRIREALASGGARLLDFRVERDGLRVRQRDSQAG
jgi:D-glycero-alpha-D-manno-heptose-7-phosphate kinase